MPLYGDLEPILFVMRIGGTLGLFAAICRLCPVLISRTNSRSYGVGHCEGPYPYAPPGLFIAIFSGMNCDSHHTFADLFEPTRSIRFCPRPYKAARRRFARKYGKRASPISRRSPRCPAAASIQVSGPRSRLAACRTNHPTRATFRGQRAAHKRDILPFGVGHRS